MLERTLDDMPVEYRDRFQELLQRPGVRVRELSEELAQYVVAVHQLKALSMTIDLGTAERIADVLGQLLADHDRHEADAQRLIQAAVEYFVREEDDEEITGVLGFDDDIQVINAVIRSLGRHELIIPFQRVDLPSSG